MLVLLPQWGRQRCSVLCLLWLLVQIPLPDHRNEAPQHSRLANSGVVPWTVVCGSGLDAIP